jgi:hypothetical protein
MEVQTYEKPPEGGFSGSIIIQIPAVNGWATQKSRQRWPVY